MNLDTQQLSKAAGMLKVMAHPLRLTIIDLLGEKTDLSVTEIYQELNIEQAVASHHLNLLKNKGLVESRREGKSCLYSLKHNRIIQIINCIEKCN